MQQTRIYTLTNCELSRLLYLAHVILFFFDRIIVPEAQHPTPAIYERARNRD